MSITPTHHPKECECGGTGRVVCPFSVIDEIPCGRSWPGGENWADPNLVRSMVWIACAERSPGMHQTVLVAGGVAQYQGGDRFDSMMPGSAGRTIEWPVTHWMPLPEPPHAT